MHRLLVPIDGSESSLRALRHALTLARLSSEAEIHVVHVHEEPLIYGEIAVYVPRDKMEQLQRQHSEAILARADGVLRDAGVPFIKSVLVGPIGPTIAAHAEQLGCDAIVMGTHGMTPLGKLITGSIATKVVHATRLPVMLVK